MTIEHRDADPITAFQIQRSERIAGNRQNARLLAAAREFVDASADAKYSYNFEWLGRPIIQYPQDIVAMQELIWKVRPDLVIETGVAHGGSLVLTASLLALLEHADAAAASCQLDPARPTRRVLGIDIEIRPHNRRAIESHPFAGRIDLLEGSSIAKEMVQEVRRRTEGAGCVLVCLDSNHTHDHVFAELEAYAPLVTPGSYCVVFDTLIEQQPPGSYPERPWDVGNNPKTAVEAFLREHPEFVIDGEIDDTLLISVAPGGFLRRLPAD